MADVALTATPLDLMAATTTDVSGAALGLDSSQIYSFQAEIPAAAFNDSNNATGPYVHVSDADAEPTNLGGGRKVRSLETIRVKAGDGGSLWAWSPGPPAVANVFVDV